MFIVLVCHGNDEKPGLPTKSIAFSTFRARRFSWVQVLWLRPGFGCIPADRQPGFCKEQWQKKISKKHQKLELYILYDPNFHLYILYIVPFSKKELLQQRWFLWAVSQGLFCHSGVRSQGPTVRVSEIWGRGMPNRFSAIHTVKHCESTYFKNILFLIIFVWMADFQ